MDITRMNKNEVKNRFKSHQEHLIWWSKCVYPFLTGLFRYCEVWTSNSSMTFSTYEIMLSVLLF